MATPSPALSAWSCPVCTFRNDGARASCAVCEQPKFDSSAYALDSVDIPLWPSRHASQDGESERNPSALPAFEMTSPRDAPGGTHHYSHSQPHSLPQSSHFLQHPQQRSFHQTPLHTQERQGGPGRPRSLAAELSEYMSESTVPTLLNDMLSGFVTAAFGFAGATVGAVAGAMAGRATSSGVVRGAGLGALAGAIVCVEALEASRAYVTGMSNSAPSSRIVGRLSAAMRSHPVPTRPVHPSDLEGVPLPLPLPLPLSLPLNLPSTVVSSRLSASLDNCPICLEVPELGSVVRSLPSCSHTFHQNCIDRWLVRFQRSCPVCRQPVLL